MTLEQAEHRIAKLEQQVANLQQIVLQMLEEQEDEMPEPKTYLDGTPRAKGLAKVGRQADPDW